MTEPNIDVIAPIVHREPAPETPEVKPAPFSKEQQELFDNAIREAQGRAGREARERAAASEKEVALLRDKAVGAAPD